MVSTFVARQKVNLRRTLYFDTRIAPEVRVCKPVFNLRMLSDTLQLKWNSQNSRLHYVRRNNISYFTLFRSENETQLVSIATCTHFTLFERFN